MSGKGARCPACGAMVSVPILRSEADPTGPAQSTAGEKPATDRCPICRAELPPNSLMCMHCGGDLHPISERARHRRDVVPAATHSTVQPPAVGMTTRTLLGRRSRWLLGLLLVAIATIFTATIIGVMNGVNFKRTPWGWASTIPVWILCIANYVLLRCPRCRGNLMMLAYDSLRAKPTVQRCPHCGLGYDEELSSMKPIEPTGQSRSPPLSPNRLEGACITARTLHKRRNRQITRVFLAGVTAMLVLSGLSFLGLLLWPAQRASVLIILVILGIIMMGGLMVTSGARMASALGFQCPRCRGRIRSFRFWWVGWDTTISCCPYCGLGWDEELSDEAPTPK
jgi:hypothetical protein